MSDIVLKNRKGEDIVYADIHTVTFDTPTEGVQATYTEGIAEEQTVSLDMAEGDQIVSANDGKLITKVTVTKPETLVPENILDGVEIGGVVGNHKDDTVIENMEIELDMADGNQTLEAADGYVVKSATIVKPETLVPENILDGVDIGGVVGNHKDDTVLENVEVELSMAEGDQTINAGDGYVVKTAILKKPDTLVPENIASGVDIAGVIGTMTGSEGTSGDYIVKVIDYDGTILKSENLNTGDVFILPDEPSHNRLVFEGWSSPVDIIDNTVTVGDSNIIIGAIYHTASGATEIDIELVEGRSGLEFKLLSYLTGYTSIDWGDETIDSELTHTYADYGEYTIKVYGITAIKNGSSSTGGIALAGTSSHNLTVKRIHFANTITSIGTYACVYMDILELVTMPNSVTSISDNIFYYDRSLKLVIFPNEITSIPSGVCSNCDSIEYFIMPNGVTSLGTYSIQGKKIEYITYPDTLTGISSLGSLFLFKGTNKSTLRLPKSLTTYPQSFLQNNYGVEEVIFPVGVTATVKYTGQMSTGIRKIIFLGDITTVADYSFYSVYGLREVDFTNCTSVPTLAGTNAFNYSYSCIIKVPASLYDEWIAASNWSTFASRIVIGD